MINKLLKGIKKPNLLAANILELKVFKFVPDKIYLKMKFRLLMGTRLNLKNPKSFNEKLQWLKLFDRKPEYTDLVDKLNVRSYIEKKIGSDYLIPLLGVYERYEDIVFDDLPNEFVLKPNHTSGNVFICKNKSEIDHEKLKKIINSWLKREYYWNHREWPYKNITPKIICEKILVEESGLDLKDYKLMCFNSKVLCSFVGLNRNSSGGLNIDFYDLDWKPLPFERHYPKSNTLTARPENYLKMIELAEKLSENTPFLRVDFYEVKGKIYFGELTFYPGSGYEDFSPEKYDNILGSWINLPDEKRVKRGE